MRDAADMLHSLSKLDMPQQIGTTMIHGNVVHIVPLVSIIPDFTFSRVFESLEEYMFALVELKRKSDRVGTDALSKASANKVLDHLAAKLPAIFRRLASPNYRRCVLSHDDLNETNILLDNHGRITGIVDWEYHSVRPIVLAAQYPCWLRYDGIYDPRFAVAEKWWTASPEDAARLRGVFAQVSSSV